MSNQKLSINQSLVVPELQPQTQHVYISESIMSDDGSQITVKLSYLTDDPTLTGVGFDLNFDTAELSLDSVSGVASGAVASGSLNSDGDALVFAWSDPFGGNWPGSTSTELATITFNVADNAAGLATLDIVEVSTPPGYSLDGQSYAVFSTDGESVSVPESVVTVPDLVADTQHVYVSESTLSADGTQVTVKLSYMVDDPTLTGVGFDLNFDTSALSLDSVSGVASGAVASGSLNADGDALVFAWSDPFGGSWPGSTEAELATITFNVIEGTTGSTSLDIVEVSTPPGYSLDGQSHEVVITAEVLPPLEITTIAIDENSGAGQVIATVANPEDGETFAFAGGDDTSVVTVPDLQANTQHVYVSESTKSDDGTQVTVKLSYMVDDPTLTGVGFDLNFDTSALSLDSVSGVASGAVASGSLNADGDALVFAWSDPFGGSWPGSTEAELATITFNVIEGTTGSTALDIVEVSTPPGYSLDGQSHEVVITAAAGDPNLSIDSATGAVTLLVDPNFEDVSAYSFDIVSSKDRSASNTSAINNVDEAAPTITSGSDAGSVDENGSAQVVYTATADDSGDVSGGVTFSLADETGPFSIDSASGDVTFSGGADFEGQTEYTFEVIATDAANNSSASQLVTLSVNNIDDSAPAVTSDAYAGAIDENSGAGQVIYTASAEDDSSDIEAGGPISYSLAAGSDAGLSIDSATGAVTLSANPDADGKSVYSFAVIATDAAGNVSEAQSVTLDINDLDDTAPTITSGSVAAEVKENSGAGQSVYTATADDSADVSGGVTFSLAGADAAAFSIDESSGEVILTDDPDYEAKSSYEFDVVATDAADNSSSKTVTLAIGNVNDFKPVFNLPIAGDIDENSGSGNAVLTVVATPDPDVSELYPITYTLEDGSDAAVSIDSATGVVSLNADPDYEAQDSYSFTVVATDAEDNSSSAAGSISVNNLDEVAPTITSANSVDAIDENDDAQVIYTASADDNADISAGVTYSLAAGSDAALSIDPATGEVSIDTSADHETQAVYSFGVIATDAANNASETTSLILNINDLDDAAPTVVSADNADSVDENSASGQIVYTATADDSADDVADGPIEFSLTDDSDAEFSIDASTGEVSFNATADHEADSEYSFSVVATDGAGNVGQPKLVTMAIVDLDDAAPVVDSGDSAVSVDENDVSGQVVYVATADDSGDDVADSPIAFSLTDDSDAEFAIDTSTGEVTFNASADHETDNEYSFSVVATDAAGNESEPQLVTMTINDLDELPPIITAPTVNKVLSAFTGEGQTIYTPNVVDDPNDVTSEPMTYSLTGGDLALFEIDSATGVVTYLPNPQTDLDTEYVPYEVTVTDSSGNKSSVGLTLEIAGKEENAPLIFAPDGEVSYQVLSEGKVVQNKGTENEIYADVVTAVVGNIDETVAAGTEIYNLDHFDATGTSFSIIDPTGDLVINEFGDVIITKQAEFERHDQYNFTVVVTDASGNQSSQDVRLLLTNLSVEENAASDQVVHTAATDFNPLGDKDLTYSLTSQSDDALVIDEATGVVTYLATPDYEAGASLDFVVEASNGETSSVSIAVNNSDDNAPVITSADTISSIDENSGTQVVYTASADDSVDSSGDVTFSLSDDSDSALSIDSSGVVTLNENPNHEAQSSYSFTVVASDEAGNESRQSLTIEVNDKDEIAPLFLSSGSSNVDENSEGELVIYTASAHSATSIVEQGAISQEFVRNDDGTLTVRLFVDPSVRSQFEAGISSAQFDLSYDSEVANSLSYVSHQVAGNGNAVVNNTFDGQINFAILFDDLATLNNEEVYDVNGDEPIAELTFAVENFDALSTVVVSNVGLKESGSNIKHFDGQSAYEYAVNDAGRVKYTLDNSGDSALLTINEDTGEVTMLAGSSGASEDSGSSIVVPELQAKTQHVYVSESTKSDDGTQVTVKLSYMVDDPTLTGVGFDLNFDTSALSLDSVSGVASGAVASGSLNADGDALVFAWSDPFGGSWPGSTEAELATITFNVIEGTTGSTALDIVEVSTPPGYSLDGQSHEVVITSGHSIDYEQQTEYNFTVIATEESGNSSSQEVTISVNNLDDTAPVVTSSDSTVSIDENNVDLVVYTATADDSLDVSDGVTFALTGSSDSGLSIDADTGVVTLNASADHETQSEYNFAVIATDAAGNASDAQSVTISVNDLDDSVDIITSGAVADAINENSGAGQVIYTATSEDLDDTSEGLAYSLTKDSDVGLSINADTGEVSLDGNPDHEAQSSYSFGVFVTDAAGNVSKTQQVTLNINDLDDAAPVINSADGALSIDENSGAGIVVYTATADDSADFSNGVSFSLSEDSDGALSIDASTGEVTLLVDPNYEARNQYTFAVVATDAAGNSSDAQQVSFSINNIDEEAPTFDGSLLFDSITENSGANQAIYTVTEASDTDSNHSGEFTFSLSDDSAAGLAIDEKSGLVTLLKNPDYESGNQYSFTVIATDVAGNSSEQTVAIDVNPETEVIVTHWGSNIRVSGVDISTVKGTVVSNGSENTFVDVNHREDAVSVDKTINEAEYADLRKVVDVEDAETMASMSVNLNAKLADYGDQGDISFDVADFNNDGFITTRDAVEVLRFVTGYETADSGSIIAPKWDFYLNTAEGVIQGSEDTVSYTAALRGDVDGSWAATQSDDNRYVPEVDESNPELVSELSVDIDAAIAAGTVVYTAVATDNSKKVFYSLDNAPEGVSIDEHTGDVVLDSSTQELTSIEFTVNMEDQDGNVGSEVVTLNVSALPDVDAPVISGDSEYAIDENSQAGLIVYSASVSDDSAVKFSLGKGSDAALSIDDDGVVTLNEESDFEGQSSYRFILVAEDEAGNTSTEKVVVTVNNSDEENPVVNVADIVHVTYENSGAGQVILNASADDSADTSDGVSLSLGGVDADKFSIDANGQVTLNADPDFEAQSSYNFTVIAADASGKSSSVSHTVLVNNVDEVAPTITLNDTVANINENSGQGQVILNASADDSADTSDGVSLSLGGADADAFTIDSDGQVTLNVDPDHESQSSYNFVVTATDKDGNSSEESHTVTVVDLDDAAPTVTSASEVDSLVENSGAGQIVYTATADDSGDDVADGPVSFSLTGADADAFTIDSNGNVTLVADPDADAQSQYNFGVVATDAAGNESEVKSLTLDVADLDEIAPQFRSDAELSIVENTDAGKLVYVNETTDGRDAPEGLSYSLSLANQDVPQLQAGIQSVYVSKEILNPNLDPNQIELTVTYLADSNELPGLGLNIHFDSSKLSVVDMKDVLSKDLIFTTPANGDDGDLDGNAATDSYVSVAWASVHGDWTSTGLPEDLLTIVFDIDGSATGSTEIGFSSSSTPVNYEFNGVEYSARTFSIDENTGNVTLNVSPDYEAQSEYNFTVSASDGFFSVDQDVTLSVLNVDDTDPTITSGAIAVSIDENSGGKVVYSAQADDSADLSEGSLTYSLANGHDAAIEISSETGDVYLLEDPDHESQSSYSFTVIVTDSTGRAVSKDVNLIINDLDDAAPTVSSESTFSIDENADAGQVVYLATADDSGDDVADTPVTFSLTADSDKEFSINSASGEVTFNASADHETDSEYSFSVVATDGAGNVGEAKAVTMTVNDLDDANPVIISEDVVIDIDENSVAQSTSIYTAEAHDDNDITDGFAFSLSQDSDAALSIDPQSGVVTLNANPDFETQPEYSFTVLVTDFAGNVSASQSVTLNVNNLDEAAPVITSADTATTVESGYVGDIYTATATDSDDISGGISFGFADAGRTDLSIDSETGVVSLNESADSAGYNFTVVASDVAGNTSSQNVSMDVYDAVSGSQPVAVSSAINQVFTHNPDGSITLNLEFNNALASQFIGDSNIQVNSIENIDFDLSYGPGISITSIEAGDKALLSFENEVESGKFEVSQIYFDLMTWTGVDLDGVSLLEVTFDLEQGVESGFTVSNATINADTPILTDGVASSIDVSIVQGTEGDDIFELSGGFTNIYTGEGVDTLIVTDQVDASVVVDFESGIDTFDVSQLLSDPESVFGGSFNDETNVLTFTVDNNAVAEVTLSEGSEFEEDDLSADLSAFIA